MLARVPARAGGDLSREQIHDGSIFVSGPYGAVESQETGSGAFLPAETERAVEQARHEPLEPDRHFAKPTTQLRHNFVDHAAADYSLADSRVRRPRRPMSEQITDCDREI